MGTRAIVKIDAGKSNRTPEKATGKGTETSENDCSLPVTTNCALTCTSGHEE
jgi:hypothetical protein